MERKFRGAQFVGARKRINENRNNSVRRNRRIYESEDERDKFHQIETDELLQYINDRVFNGQRQIGNIWMYCENRNSIGALINITFKPAADEFYSVDVLYATSAAMSKKPEFKINISASNIDLYNNNNEVIAKTTGIILASYIIENDDIKERIKDIANRYADKFEY